MIEGVEGWKSQQKSKCVGLTLRERGCAPPVFMTVGMRWKEGKDLVLIGYISKIFMPFLYSHL